METELALDSYKQPARGQIQRPIRKIYRGVVLYDKLNDEVEDIGRMDTREDDVWVCSFPRSGTTLTQELVYLIQTLDYDTANSVQLEERFPEIEMKNQYLPYFKGLKYVEQLKSPRMIKSHLHYFLLPESLQTGKGKIIYICRNPKDVAVSYFRFLAWTEMMHDAYNTMDTFVDTFVDGKLFACPWPKHILGYWEHRHEPHMLFLRYEDLIKDLHAAIRRIADFLGRVLTEQDVDKIASHCHIDNMRKNDMVNWKYWEKLKPMNKDYGGAFINKGKAGGWHDVLTSEQSAKIDTMLQELEESGLEIAET